MCSRTLFQLFQPQRQRLHLNLYIQLKTKGELMLKFSFVKALWRFKFKRVGDTQENNFLIGNTFSLVCKVETRSNQNFNILNLFLDTVVDDTNRTFWLIMFLEQYHFKLNGFQYLRHRTLFYKSGKCKIWPKILKEAVYKNGAPQWQYR